VLGLLTSKLRNKEEVYDMLRSQLVSEITEAEAKIIETEQHPKFSREYKDKTIAQQKAHIAKLNQEIIGYDKLTDQSNPKA